MNQPIRKSPALGEASDQLAGHDLETLSAKNDNKSTAPDNRRCGNCSYFDHSQECRVRPPIVAETHLDPRWPTVYADEWCGEFVPMLDASDGGA
ncbi:hypothetical protein [uncultured Parasphingorhabdus sp.]|uniref:hypothetical protein n=1 Tax=uncultured Parasphingorhabdus sp. TaxID=2709694 RepID=UPI002AA6DE5A|nr:hypothetical protein [uncultured Parasphingorhabdus sp.]